MEYMTDVLGIISDTLDISHGTEGPGKEDMVLFAESAPSGQVDHEGDDFVVQPAQRQIEVAHRKSRHIDYLVLRLKHRANRARNAPIPANAENMIVVDMVLAPPNIPRTTIGAVTVVPIFAP